jgi:hypothetical protein
MRRSPFLRISSQPEKHDLYFLQKANAAKKMGLSTIYKVTAALRQLAYCAPADAVDEYVGIGESTAVENLRRFCLEVTS